MRITRETDYAVRCILHLAGENGSVTMVNEVARCRAVPRTFLAKILQKLSRAGIVRSHRGVRGGFILDRHPSRITLLDVVEAIEGPVELNRCVAEEGACHLRGACVVHPVWGEASRRLASQLGKYDFETLAREEKKGNDSNN